MAPVYNFSVCQFLMIHLTIKKRKEQFQKREKHKTKQVIERSKYH